MGKRGPKPRGPARPQLNIVLDRDERATLDAIAHLRYGSVTELVRPAVVALIQREAKKENADELKAAVATYRARYRES